MLDPTGFEPASSPLQAVTFTRRPVPTMDELKNSPLPLDRDGASGRSRTLTLRSRIPALYPVELRTPSIDRARPRRATVLLDTTAISGCTLSQTKTPPSGSPEAGSV